MGTEDGGRVPSWTEPLGSSVLILNDPDFLWYLLFKIGLKERWIRRALGSTKGCRFTIGSGRMSRTDFARWLHDETFGPTKHQKAALDNLRIVVGMLVNSRLLYHDEVGRFLWYRHSNGQRPILMISAGGVDIVQRIADELIQNMKRLRSGLDLE